MKKLILICFIGLGLATAHAGEKESKVSNENHKIITVAHRGASKFAPENTIAAFLKAGKMGVDMCEMDIRQTKDGHFVIMHDGSVSRTTDGKGLVKNMTLEDIKKLDAGGEPVPTLREVLKAIKGKILPDLDFKDGNVKDLVKLLEEEGYLEEGNVTFHGSWSDVKKVKKLTDKLLVRPSAKGGESGFENLLEEIDPPVVNINWSSFTEYFVKAIQKKGKKAFVNTLRRADKKKNMVRAIEAGADYIQSDNLDILLPLVKEHNSKIGQ